MLLREAVPVTAQTTATTLHDALSTMGARLILDALRDWPAPVAQPEDGVTYAAKLTREDGKLDFAQPAAALDRRVRALTPWPGTYAQFGGENLKILAATPADGSGKPGTILDARFTVACGEGALRLDRVQRAGRPAVPGDAFLRGMPDWTRLIFQIPPGQ